MKRIIKSMEEKYLTEAAQLVEEVFTDHENAEEGRLVRNLVEEIRSKKYYLPELELITVDEKDEVIGYVMFSRFHLEGKFENELLMLTPAAVKTKLQRQHICRDMIEYGFEKAKALGYKLVIVEGNPDNYRARGFSTAADKGILPGKTVHLPRIECLMVKELTENASEKIRGTLEYSFYKTLSE